MAQLGTTNNLSITTHTEQGIYLDGESLGQILLPKRDIPENYQNESSLDVFIYLDSDDQPIATTRKPKVMLGECAFLKLIDMNKIGAFFDWGMPKDLLVPYAEQPNHLRKGHSYVVFLYQDRASKRLVGSIKLSKHLNEHATHFKAKQSVELLICGKSELGYKAVINHTHLGLIHHSDVFKNIKIGDKTNGYIKSIRDDGKINLILNLPNKKHFVELAEQIIEDLRKNHGISELTDHSPPQDIYNKWQVSKSSYKKAIGSLYKEKRITISDKYIKLASGDT